MRTATEKQLNLLKKLNIEFNENITIKEASILIAKTLKQNRQNNNTTTNNTESKKDVKPQIIFDTEHVKKLLNKYNAFYTTGNSGNYNNDKGSNYKSELLSDSRKFKSYINKVLKTELQNDLINIKCSFAKWYSKEIIITLKAPSAKLFKNYNEIRADYNNHFSGFDVMRYYKLNANFNYNNYNDFGCLEPSTEKRIYNEFLKNQTLQFKDNFTKYILSDNYYNRLNFIYNLLLSYSYDFSDIQTDYFDHGLHIEIYFEAIEKDENKANNFKEKFYYLKSDNQLELLKYYPLEENEENELKQAFEEYKKESDRVMEEYRKQDEQRKLEIEAYNKQIAAENEIINNNVEYYEIKEQNIFNCNFSAWNKPCNINEAKEYCQEHPEAFGETIANVHEVINFTNQKALDYFNNNLLENREFLQSVNCGCCHVNLNTMESLDYKECYSMSNEERILNNIGWMRGCVIIALNNKPIYLVDTEGSNYCRYVGFLPNSYNIDLTPVQNTIQ